MTAPESWPRSGATRRAERRSGAKIGPTIGPTIVPMTEAHIEALMAHEQEMFGTEAWTRGGYRSELEDRRNRYYIAVEDADGALLGWAGVMMIGTTAEIHTVGVIPAARGRGLARLMIDDLLAEAKRRGGVEAFLEVRVDNTAARALYASEGFEEVGTRRGYYDAGRVDGVTMRKQLG